MTGSSTGARTAAAHYAANPRFVCYLSAEYLLGRQLDRTCSTPARPRPRAGRRRALGLGLDELGALDVEPGLGNGGLGRLAACLLDSLATLDIPAVGYGIRYEFGIFRQTFRDGGRSSGPTTGRSTATRGSSRAPRRPAAVGFCGHTEATPTTRRPLPRALGPGEIGARRALPHAGPGLRHRTVNILRLWRARATEARSTSTPFNAGDYTRGRRPERHAENITKVLYPDDSTGRAGSCG